MSDTDPLVDLKKHKRNKDWWSAREEIERLLTDGNVDEIKLRQQYAICTYKDPELRRGEALDVAVERLVGDDSISPDDVGDAETAGLLGAICKRRWDLDGREHHLRDARRWYERGAVLAASASPSDWDGYHEVNTAFVADVLASLRDDESSDALRNLAASHRSRVVERLGSLDEPNWWQLASLLEAYVGLGRRDDYRGLLARVDEMAGVRAEARAEARALGVDAPTAIVDSWERESTAAQMVRLATVLESPPDPDDVRDVVAAIVPEAHVDAVGAIGRRFGVALSGGGFRASLFHLGVLAAFAERDLLRRLEVLSCVSGGSIVGAAYYSAVAELIEDADDDITPEHMVRATRRCIDVMTDVVTSNNVRMQAFTSPVALARGVKAGRWSRTKRGGMLYERYLYRALRPSGSFETLSDLKIFPGSSRSFRPKIDNWRRGTKVPTLLINATSLGTGRPWRFSATSIGEPDDTGSDTDPMDRLEPIWLDRIAENGAVSRISVGDAVAASAGVPGLFPPLRLTDLYPDRTVVLVDGGVFDNQGTSGLLDHDCTDIFVSDASGLMGEKKKPSSNVLRVLLRTNSVALNAVRRVTFGEAAAVASGGSVRSVWAVHLLSGLPVHSVPSLAGGSDDVRRGDEGLEVEQQAAQAISELRTDLDRFTKAEAYALMHRGYTLTNAALDTRPHPLAAERVPNEWAFSGVKTLLEDSASADQLVDELRTGRRKFFKWFPLGRHQIVP